MNLADPGKSKASTEKELPTTRAFAPMKADQPSGLHEPVAQVGDTSPRTPGRLSLRQHSSAVPARVLHRMPPISPRVFHLEGSVDEETEVSSEEESSTASGTYGGKVLPVHPEEDEEDEPRLTPVTSASVRSMRWREACAAGKLAQSAGFLRPSAVAKLGGSWNWMTVPLSPLSSSSATDLAEQVHEVLSIEKAAGEPWRSVPAGIFRRGLVAAVLVVVAACAFGLLLVAVLPPTLSPPTSADSGTPEQVPDTALPETGGWGWSVEVALQALYGGSLQHFGHSISLSGDTALVASAAHDAAFVFVRSGSTWLQQAKLKVAKSDATSQQYLGSSVSLAGNIGLLGVSSSSSGCDSAYVFERNGSTWSIQAKLAVPRRGSSHHRCDISVSLNPLGAEVVIGVPSKMSEVGAAYVYARSGDTWTTEAQLLAADGAEGYNFGTSVSIAGSRVLVGAPGVNCPHAGGAGAAYVFVREGSTWVQEAKLVATEVAAPGLFGVGVALGKVLAVIGASGFCADDGKISDAGAVYIFDRTLSSWTQMVKLQPEGSSAGDECGRSVALFQDRVAFGCPGAARGDGSVHVFVHGGSSWKQQAQISASHGGGNLGHSIALGWATSVGTGTSLATLAAPGSVGELDSSSSSTGAKVFTLMDATPELPPQSAPARALTGLLPAPLQLHTMSAPASAAVSFGSSVSLSAAHAIVGARTTDDVGGGAWIYVRGGALWYQEAELQTDGGLHQTCGWAVALASDTALVGCHPMNEVGRAHIFVRSGLNWTEQAELGGGAGDFAFGNSVAMDGDTAIVGSYVSGDFRGVAYVFVRTGLTWSQQAMLRPTDSLFFDHFAWAVCLSGDTALIGANSANSLRGAAYIFQRNGSAWTEQAKLTAWDGSAGDLFGEAVAISGDIALISAIGRTEDAVSESGAVYIFRYDDVSWSQQAKLLPVSSVSMGHFGQSVSLVGEVAAIGAPGEEGGGNIYIFSAESGEWALQAQFKAAENSTQSEFGFSVSMTENLLLVGAPQDDDVVVVNGSGQAHIFSLTTATEETEIVCSWQLCQMGKLSNSDGAFLPTLGTAIAIAGETALVSAGATDYPAVYSFTRTSTSWSMRAVLAPEDGLAHSAFGQSTSLDSDGSRAVVGADGAAYAFESSSSGGASWSQEGKLTCSDCQASDKFGFSVSMNGGTTLVGAYKGGDDDNGAAYVFVSGSDGSWSQQAKLVEVNAAGVDSFGWAVDVKGDTAVVSAPSDDGGDILAPSSGSVYIFTRSGSTWSQVAKLRASDAGEGQRFGHSVSMAEDGETVLIGTDGGSAAYIFQRSESGWAQQAKLEPEGAASEENFGYSVSLGVHGAVVGAPAPEGSGAAYFFRETESGWSQEARLAALSDDTSSADFGVAVAQSSGVIVAGSPSLGGGGAFSFHVTKDSAQIIPSDTASGMEFGVAVSLYGSQALVGANSSEQQGAYIFVEAGGEWLEKVKLLPDDPLVSDSFGVAVSLQADLALVGAVGAAYVFAQVGGAWSQQAILTPDDGVQPDFAHAVSLSGTTALVGAFSGSDSSGAAYVFILDGSSWIQQAKLTALVPQQLDGFGRSVSLDQDTALIGSPGVDAFRGTAYVFARVGTAWALQGNLRPGDLASETRFGWSCAMSGDTALVGMSPSGETAAAVYIFQRLAPLWVQEAKVEAPAGAGGFGIAVSLFGASSLAIVGAPGNSSESWIRGAAYAFRKEGSEWLEHKSYVSTGQSDDYGSAVSLSSDGIALVGARFDGNAGAAYVVDVAGVFASTTTETTSSTTTSTSFTTTSLSSTKTATATSVTSTSTVTRTATDTSETSTRISTTATSGTTVTITGTLTSTRTHTSVTSTTSTASTVTATTTSGTVTQTSKTTTTSGTSTRTSVSATSSTTATATTWSASSTTRTTSTTITITGTSYTSTSSTTTTVTSLTTTSTFSASSTSTHLTATSTSSDTLTASGTSTVTSVSTTSSTSSSSVSSVTTITTSTSSTDTITGTTTTSVVTVTSSSTTTVTTISVTTTTETSTSSTSTTGTTGTGTSITKTTGTSTTVSTTITHTSRTTTSWTTSTTTTTTTFGQEYNFSATWKNMVYEKLLANLDVQLDCETTIQVYMGRKLAKLSITEYAVGVTWTEGSVVANVQILYNHDMPPEELALGLGTNADVAVELEDLVSDVDNIELVLKDGAGVPGVPDVTLPYGITATTTKTSFTLTTVTSSSSSTTLGSYPLTFTFLGIEYSLLASNRTVETSMREALAGFVRGKLSETGLGFDQWEQEWRISAGGSTSEGREPPRLGRAAVGTAVFEVELHYFEGTSPVTVGSLVGEKTTAQAEVKELIQAVDGIRSVMQDASIELEVELVYPFPASSTTTTMTYVESTTETTTTTIVPYEVVLVSGTNESRIAGGYLIESTSPDFFVSQDGVELLREIFRQEAQLTSSDPVMVLVDVTQTGVSGGVSTLNVEYTYSVVGSGHDELAEATLLRLLDFAGPDLEAAMQVVFPADMEFRVLTSPVLGTTLSMEPPVEEVLVTPAAVQAAMAAVGAAAAAAAAASSAAGGGGNGGGGGGGGGPAAVSGGGGGADASAVPGGGAGAEGGAGAGGGGEVAGSEMQTGGQADGGAGGELIGEVDIDGGDVAGGGEGQAGAGDAAGGADGGGEAADGAPEGEGEVEGEGEGVEEEEDGGAENGENEDEDDNNRRSNPSAPFGTFIGADGHIFDITRGHSWWRVPFIFYASKAATSQIQITDRQTGRIFVMDEHAKAKMNYVDVDGEVQLRHCSGMHMEFAGLGKLQRQVPCWRRNLKFLPGLILLGAALAMLYLDASKMGGWTFLGASIFSTLLVIFMVPGSILMKIYNCIAKAPPACCRDKFWAVVGKLVDIMPAVPALMMGIVFPDPYFPLSIVQGGILLLFAVLQSLIPSSLEFLMYLVYLATSFSQIGIGWNIAFSNPDLTGYLLSGVLMLLKSAVGWAKEMVFDFMPFDHSGAMLAAAAGSIVGAANVGLNANRLRALVAMKEGLPMSVNMQKTAILGLQSMLRITVLAGMVATRFTVQDMIHKTMMPILQAIRKVHLDGIKAVAKSEKVRDKAEQKVMAQGLMQHIKAVLKYPLKVGVAEGRETMEKANEHFEKLTSLVDTMDSIVSFDISAFVPASRVLKTKTDAIAKMADQILEEFNNPPRDVIEVTVPQGDIGMEVDSMRGCVVSVTPRSVADENGIVPGWVICSIDRERFSFRLLTDRVLGEVPYTIAFQAREEQKKLSLLDQQARKAALDTKLEALAFEVRMAQKRNNKMNFASRGKFERGIERVSDTMPPLRQQTTEAMLQMYEDSQAAMQLSTGELPVENVWCKEGETLEIPMQVEIKYAWFGLSSKVRSRVDVTKTVQEQYEEGRRTFEASSNLFGNPARFHTKELRVGYVQVKEYISMEDEGEPRRRIDGKGPMQGRGSKARANLLMGFLEHEDNEPAVSQSLGEFGLLSSPVQKIAENEREVQAAGKHRALPPGGMVGETMNPRLVELVEGIRDSALVASDCQEQMADAVMGTRGMGVMMEMAAMGLEGQFMSNAGAGEGIFEQVCVLVAAARSTAIISKMIVEQLQNSAERFFGVVEKAHEAAKEGEATMAQLEKEIPLSDAPCVTLENVRSGTRLLAKEPSTVFQSASSWKQIDVVNAAQIIEAAGAPVKASGYIMVPIKPSGVVEASTFMVYDVQASREIKRKAVPTASQTISEDSAVRAATTASAVSGGADHVTDGSAADDMQSEKSSQLEVAEDEGGARPDGVMAGANLLCLEDTTIYLNVEGKIKLGNVEGGEVVTASGSLVVDEDLRPMVPIEPTGAVDLTHFRVQEHGNDQEDLEQQAPAAQECADGGVPADPACSQGLSEGEAESLPVYGEWPSDGQGNHAKPVKAAPRRGGLATLFSRVQGRNPDDEMEKEHFRKAMVARARQEKQSNARSRRSRLRQAAGERVNLLDAEAASPTASRQVRFAGVHAMDPPSRQSTLESPPSKASMGPKPPRKSQARGEGTKESTVSQLLAVESSTSRASMGPKVARKSQESIRTSKESVRIGSKASKSGEGALPEDDGGLISWVCGQEGLDNCFFEGQDDEPQESQGKRYFAKGKAGMEEDLCKSARLLAASLPEQGGSAQIDSDAVMSTWSQKDTKDAISKEAPPSSDNPVQQVAHVMSPILTLLPMTLCIGMELFVTIQVARGLSMLQWELFKMLPPGLLGEDEGGGDEEQEGEELETGGGMGGGDPDVAQAEEEAEETGLETAELETGGMGGVGEAHDGPEAAELEAGGGGGGSLAQDGPEAAEIEASGSRSPAQDGPEAAELEAVGGGGGSQAHGGLEAAELEAAGGVGSAGEAHGGVEAAEFEASAARDEDVVPSTGGGTEDVGITQEPGATGAANGETAGDSERQR